MWVDGCPPLEAAQNTIFDPVLQALSACPHLKIVTILTEFASADAIRNLLHLPTDTDLSLGLTPDHWPAMADEIRLGRCLIKNLSLDMIPSSSSEDTVAVKAVASAIRKDHHLESLELRMENGFTDEAGVTLAEALKINKTLRMLILDDGWWDGDPVHSKPSLGAQAYEAFGAMLRVNASIELNLPPFDDAVGDQRLVDSCNQMRIEQGLNNVGRGRLLSSSLTTRKEWVDALHELSSNVVDEASAFRVSCLYSVLRSNPTAVCMS
jgi:hypothetical protein